MATSTHVTTVARGGRAARIALYLGQMFPPSSMLPAAASHFFAIWFGLQALGSTAPVGVTWTSLRGVATVALFLLLMRLYDELKDAATDIALGRAGDPLYRDRVLVTGAVLLEDVHVLRWAATAAVVAVNLRLEFAWASVAFWVVFGVTWLSFNWFFWPRISKHILLAFITHNPISLLLAGYVVALFVDAFGAEQLNVGAIPLLIGVWLPIAAWETSRKVRAPEDETAYQTYSRVLGWKTAALLPAIFAVGSAASLAIVAARAELGLSFPVFIGAAAGLVVFRCALFRVAPTRQHADLKPWAMFFVASANAGLAIAVALNRGLAW